METTTPGPFAGAPVIHAYTAEDAVADGLFQAAPDTIRRDAGYRCPVVFSRAAWEYAVQWDTDDPRPQDENGRLWDVLMMMRPAVRQAIAQVGERFAFQFVAVPRLTAAGNRSQREGTTLHTLEVVAQGYNRDGAPCLTLLLPGQS